MIKATLMEPSPSSNIYAVKTSSMTNISSSSELSSSDNKILPSAQKLSSVSSVRKILKSQKLLSAPFSIALKKSRARSPSNCMAL